MITNAGTNDTSMRIHLGIGFGLDMLSFSDVIVVEIREL